MLLCSSFCFCFAVCPVLFFVVALLFGGWLFWVSCVVFVVVTFALFVWRLLSTWVVVFLAGPVQTFVENAGVCSRSVGNGSHALFSVFLRWFCSHWYHRLGFFYMGGWFLVRLFFILLFFVGGGVLACLLACLFVCLFVCSLVRSFVCLSALVCLFVRSFVHSFVCLLSCSVSVSLLLFVVVPFSSSGL